MAPLTKAQVTTLVGQIIGASDINAPDLQHLRVTVDSKEYKLRIINNDGEFSVTILLRSG
jgi:hypothetical protein